MVFHWSLSDNKSPQISRSFLNILAVYYYYLPDIGLGVRVFANGPGDLGSIPGRVIPKTQKMVLDASLLNTQHYKVRIKGKVEQSRKGVAPSPTHWCSSYRKGSLRVTLNYGRQLLLIIIIIIIIIIYFLRVFHISVSWWFFSGVWVNSKTPQVSRTLLSIIIIPFEFFGVRCCLLDV